MSRCHDGADHHGRRQGDRQRDRRGLGRLAAPRLDQLDAYGDSEVGEELKGIPDLLGALSDASKRPLVDGRAILRTVADPTAPTLFAYPGVDELSWADGSQARTLVGRWRDSAGSLDNATAGSGRPVQLIDLTGVKALTSTTAANLLESILADLSAGGWSNGLTLARNQFVGRPHLAKVWLQCARGAMIRLPQRDTRPDHSRPMLDVIIESAPGMSVLTRSASVPAGSWLMALQFWLTTGRRWPDGLEWTGRV